MTPRCPPQGRVKGTITPAQWLPWDAQGVAAGEFDEFVRAIRASATYANARSFVFSPGDIRGQIEDDHRHH
jgi:hypothetical protein